MNARFTIFYYIVWVKERDNMKKINLNIKPDTYQAFQKLCESRGTNVSAAVRGFMAEEIKKANFDKNFKAEKK